MAKFSVSERFACRVLDQHRSTQRKKPRGRADEAALTADIRARYPVWSLRLPPDHGDAEVGRLVGERQARRADLATGGAESAAEATEEGPPLAE
jgi:hypothetical protein